MAASMQSSLDTALPPKPSYGPRLGRRSAMGPRPSGAARQGAFGATVTFIVLFVVDFLLKGGHFSAFDLKTLCMNALPLVLVALGQFFVVLTNGIDLSLGPMMSV